MDINQAARMIEWLDEERRRDKAMISTLEERLAQQQNVIDTLNRRLNSMESDQTVIRNEFLPQGRDSDIIDQLRKEMQQMIESVETKRLTSEREAERRSDINRDNIMKTVRELTDKASKIEKQTIEIPALNVERDRLAATVSNLQQRVDDITKKLEEPDRRLVYLEEQRRQDTRRLAEVESELPEARKQIDAMRPKMSLLEELALRNERKILDVMSGDRERREQIQQFLDQQMLYVQQRDQEVEQLMKRFGEQESSMQRNFERFESWSEAYRDMKRIIDDFERIADRLERRINEVGEMQRLSEERFRQEWNDWRSDDQKRWKQFTLSNDEVWRQHDKEFERYVEQFTEFEHLIPPLRDAIDRLWHLERKRAEIYRDRYQELLREFDTGGSLSPSAPAIPATPPAPQPVPVSAMVADGSGGSANGAQ